ncbi:unnamed protein product [Rhodiola kirilowii]
MNMWDNPNRNNPNLSYKSQNQSPLGFPYRQQQSNAPYQPRNQYNNQPQQQRNQNSGQYNYQSQQPKHQESGSSANIKSLLTSFMAEQDREPGKLPSKLDPNPRASTNAITLRRGKLIEMLPAQATRPSTTKSAPNSTPAEEQTSKEAENQAKNSTQTVEPAPYRPPVSFP